MPPRANEGAREGETGTLPAAPAVSPPRLTSRPRLVPPRGDVRADRLDLERGVAARVDRRHVLRLADDHLAVRVEKLEGDLRGLARRVVEVGEEPAERHVLVARLELAHRHFERQ